MPASSWNFWLGLLASAGFVAGFIVAVLRWGHNQIVRSVEERITTVRSAVTPNGGSSMADAVNRIETKLQNIGERQKDIKAELDTIREDMDEIGLKLERHLGAHEGLV